MSISAEGFTLSSKQMDFGLYETKTEQDSCGIGAVVNISGKADHSIIEYGKEILVNLHHRGAAGADETTGDGEIGRAHV